MVNTLKIKREPGAFTQILLILILSKYFIKIFFKR